MKKTRREIGGYTCWNKAVEDEVDIDAIRDKQICKVLRKIGVLQLVPIESMGQRGFRWRLNVDKILEIVEKKPENFQDGADPKAELGKKP